MGERPFFGFGDEMNDEINAQTNSIDNLTTQISETGSNRKLQNRSRRLIKSQSLRP